MQSLRYSTVTSICILSGLLAAQLTGICSRIRCPRKPFRVPVCGRPFCSPRLYKFILRLHTAHRSAERNAAVLVRAAITALSPPTVCSCRRLRLFVCRALSAPIPSTSCRASAHELRLLPPTRTGLSSQPRLAMLRSVFVRCTRATSRHPHVSRLGLPLRFSRTHTPAIPTATAPAMSSSSSSGSTAWGEDDDEVAMMQQRTPVRTPIAYCWIDTTPFSDRAFCACAVLSAGLCARAYWQLHPRSKQSTAAGVIDPLVFPVHAVSLLQPQHAALVLSR